MRCLITGGSGFIGSRLANKLMDLGHEVIITGTDGEQTPRCSQKLNLPLSEIDVGKLGHIDVVFNLAANNDTLSTDRDAMFLANYFWPMELFKNLALYGCRQFVYASSTAVYGNAKTPFTERTIPQPLNVYGESKVMFDNFAKEFANTYGVNTTGLRYCNVYGPGEEHKGKRASMIYQLLTSIMRGQQPKLFQSGEQRREWIYVDDVVEANLKAMNHQGSGIFNCATGKPISFNDLLGKINKVLGTDFAPEYIENPNPEQYQDHIETNIDRIQKQLQFTPQFDLESGIAALFEHYSELPRR